MPETGAGVNAVRPRNRDCRDAGMWAPFMAGTRRALLPLQRIDHVVERGQHGVAVAEVKREQTAGAAQVDAGIFAALEAEPQRRRGRVRLRQVALEKRVDFVIGGLVAGAPAG